ncbi:HPr family phosphocarrier protein [Oribacterium sp. WCC10]|uniref:HPr family phosphocarrier protein n=1 Tax=Oribacterium sp. WCC10 TaxID=1855343 RepID=UPI0008EAB327|nr:HPr family phosphocarrier protein [Oribacterium sp. WCC10]SFG29236.1 catabolite repression HPr-like protein [Oribacterium sp. WCC10]
MKDTNVVVNLPKKADDHPIAMLVQIASRYESRIYMAEGPRKVNAKSIMGMMALGINNGQEINISAEGTDEDAAVDAISEYLQGVAV